MNKIKVLIFAIFLLTAQAGHADTHTVSGDCSASAVQSAINAASGGDIIDVTCTGTVTWSSGLTLSGGKTLKGGGAKGSGGTDGTFPLVINNTYNGSAIISITNSDSQAVNRVTGFKFQGTGNPTWIISVVGKGTGSDGYGAFRIDNNFFNDVSYSSRLLFIDGTTGKMTGLTDHNIFYYTTPAYGNISYANSSHSGSATCYGYDSWARSVGFGTDDFVFFEDNYFWNTAIETSMGGGRVVVRHNAMSSDRAGDMVGLDGHGSDTGGQHCIGIVAAEFYNNTLTGADDYHQVVDMRGGTWRVFNNTTQSGTLQFNEYRFYRPSIIEWKACSGDFCCPATPAQCNVQSPTYPTDYAACHPLPYQVKDTFVWNNILSGSNMTPTYPDGYGDVSPWIALNTDFWMPTYGTEANLPATCTDDDNTFYGATDSGKLWECTGTNTWTLKYTPYTYPHPLQGGEDETPPTVSSVTISSNGTDLVIVFSESITATDNAAFTVDPTGADVTVDCPAVETYTNTMTCVISRAIQYSETAVYGYTGTNVVDTSANALATISNTPSVANNSTQGITPGAATHSGGIFGGCSLF